MRIMSVVTPASDFERVASNIVVWHGYDASVRAELYSTCLVTTGGAYLIDPIPLQPRALNAVVGSSRIAGVIVTNSNHHRAAVQFAQQTSVPIFAHKDAFTGRQSESLTTISDGDEISDGLNIMAIDGAPAGEIVIHYANDRGMLIVGDALINFEPHGFTCLPAKYCVNQKECAARSENFWITKPSVCFLRMARRFCRARTLTSASISQVHFTRIGPKQIRRRRKDQ